MINVVSFISERLTNISQAAEVSPMSDYMQGLFPSLPVLIASLVSLFILVIVVSYFAYFPVKKFLAERKSYIANNIQESEKMNTDAQQSLVAANNKLANSKKEGIDIIQKYTEKANKEAKMIVTEAKEQSKKIVQDANVRIKNTEKKMRIDLNQEIVDIAIKATEKLLKENIDNDTNKKLVDDFIKKIEK